MLEGLELLLAERDIRACMGRYCRGVDRADADLLGSAYWPDAFDDHVAWQGRAKDLVPWLTAAMHGFDHSFHMIGQSNITFRSRDEAEVETYLLNYLRPKSAGETGRDVLQCGRYLDLFTRREGEWRIAFRRVVTDAMRELAGPYDPAAVISGAVWPRGSIGPDDPSYRMGQ